MISRSEEQLAEHLLLLTETPDIARFVLNVNISFCQDATFPPLERLSVAVFGLLVRTSLS